jgi:parallel beta-helix repeat protein
VQTKFQWVAVVIKYVSVAVLLIFSFVLVAGIHIVGADSTDYIRFSSGVVIFSPLNRTYNSRFLTLNLTFGVGLGVESSLNFSIDEKYVGLIHLVPKNPTEIHVINEATGYVTLPELSEGAHQLAVNVLSGIYDYHGANSPGAPFTPTSPDSSDYVASWTNTIYFTIDTQLQETMIYIRAEGSVEGTDKIQREGNIYTFTNNIKGSIIVEKDNILVDGAKYTLQGDGEIHGPTDISGMGLQIIECNNVTIKNLTIKEFTRGVRFTNSSDCLITQNILDNNSIGIEMGYVDESYSNNNAVSGNFIKENKDAGIRLIYGSSNTISGNIIAENDEGVSIWGTSGNNIEWNNITSNNRGIYVETSGINIIHHNNFVNNTYDWWDYGLTPWPFQLPFSVNIWDDRKEGNYWDTYNGSDNDGDGIGDTPYELYENNQDNYPLMEPKIIPEFPSWTPIIISLVNIFTVIVFYKWKLKNGGRSE